MKRTYRTPVVKMVDYAFKEHVTAEFSFPVAGWADPGVIDVCTHNDGVCYDIYNVMMRGLNSCKEQGKIPGVEIDPNAP